MNQPDLQPEALVPISQQPLARPSPSVGDMLQAMVDRGITGENVEALKAMVELKERVDAREAEKEFARAFASLQSDMPAVKAMRPVPNKDGTLRYRFAPYEEIMEQAQPLLQKHGFAVSFSTDYAEGRLVKICTLTHTGGHSRSNKFAVRIGGGPPGSSDSQADGAASTYAKRFALCDALNIQIDHDTDARAEGDTILKEQAEELSHRVEMLGTDKVKFLKLAHAPSFAEIKSAVYPILDDFLRAKEQKGR